jgi:long-chain acyl-CoA synthetase
MIGTKEIPESAVDVGSAESVDAVIEEPRTLSELFTYAAGKFRRPDALSYKRNGKWRHISSSEMARRMENIALGLYQLGLRKGDRAAILAANSPEWTLADGGCQFAGVLDVPIYTTLAESSIITSSKIPSRACSSSKIWRCTATLPRCCRDARP